MNTKSLFRLSLVPLSILLFAVSWFLIGPAFSDEVQVTGAETLTIEDDAVLWSLTNSSSRNAVIEQIEITWPEQYGNLRQIVFNGRIFKGQRIAPTATFVAADLGNEKHRTLKKGKSRELHFKFDNAFAAAQSPDILINVDFESEQRISFVAGLPPDPGKAGEETLEGIDSDGDGVRDDIQRWIVLDVEANDATKHILSQAARLNNKTLLESADSVSSNVNTEDLQAALYVCLRTNMDGGFTLNTSGWATDLLAELDMRFHNTRERAQRWAQAMDHQSEKTLSRSYNLAKIEEQYRAQCDESKIMEGFN